VSDAPPPVPEGFRLERLLPLACLAGAALLVASELMTTFELTPPGVDPQCAQSAIDRHHYAPIVLAVAAVIGVLVVLVSGSKPAAFAVAACGILALLIFLVIDLPDANNVGTISDACGSIEGSFIDAKAVPQPGFWLELVGSLALTISGMTLASLSYEQLAALRPRWLSADRTRRRRAARSEPAATGQGLIADTDRFRDEVGPGGPSANDRPAGHPTREKEGT
jgi:hypothetical protein